MLINNGAVDEKKNVKRRKIQYYAAYNFNLFLVQKFKTIF